MLKLTTQTKQGALLLTLACLLLSCGQPQHKEHELETKAQERPHKLRKFGGTPLLLELDDPECQDPVARLSTSTEVRFADPTRVIPLRVDLSRYRGRGLQGPGIAGVYIDGKHTIDYQEGGFVERIARGPSLRICQHTGGFRRFSLENAALAATYGVHKAHEAFERIRPELDKVGPLAPVHILIQARTSELIHLPEKTLQREFTDNAVWLESQQNFYLSFLAHSKERNNLYPAKFWEQPAVVAHEYGHHVFHALSSGLSAMNGREPSERAETQTLALRGIDEGFADLFAFYTFASSEGSPPFSGRLAFSPTRDLDCPYMLIEREGSLMSKALDEAFLAEYFAEASNDQRQASLQDEHTLGAVLAYTLKRLFVEAAHPHSEPTRVPLRSLLRWALALGQHGASLRVQHQGNGRAFLAASLWLAVKVAYGDGAAPSTGLDANACRKLSELFPEFYEGWLEKPLLESCRGAGLLGFLDHALELSTV